MSAQYMTRRFLTASRPVLKSPLQSAAETVKKAAEAFKPSGSIGSKFTGDGSIGKTVDENVGGPFSKDGSVGQKFERGGSVGGRVEDAARTVERAAAEEASTTTPIDRKVERTVEDAAFKTRNTVQGAGIKAKRTAQDINDRSKDLGRD
ncbi:hypothetical protein DFS34DRAFT_688777 [Phlyctochytrium arcticum]|nr:hypothetical protein DFS34DRAFT_688777 [Phlyctochytrium arcticum]